MVDGISTCETHPVTDWASTTLKVKDNLNAEKNEGVLFFKKIIIFESSACAGGQA